MDKWQDIASAPKDGTLLDVLFDPATAERDAAGSMAEFYAPGCTRRKNPSQPIIERVAFINRHFRPVMDDGFPLHACDMAVTLTKWRRHGLPTPPETTA